MAQTAPPPPGTTPHTSPVEPAPPSSTARLRARSQLGDRIFSLLVLGTALVIVANAVGLLGTTGQRGLEALLTFGLGFLASSTWNPVTQEFAVLPAIYGTLITSLLALLLAVPIGIGAAIFLAELAPARIANPLSLLIELLAAIPSVIIGLWGLFVVVPIVRQVERWLGGNFGFLPIFSGPAFGIGLLAAAVLLAIMILPIITAVSRDVLKVVPASQREAMLALGATRWEVISRAVLPYGRSGIVGAIILALGRAIGETLAVSMVIGNTFKIEPSLFAPATTLASLIATQFREADTPLFLSALMAAGLVLFAMSMIVNVGARLVIWRMSAGLRI